ncbi:hypothetical protein AMTRI_Chr03g144760 [Amborella trichopoda]
MELQGKRRSWIAACESTAMFLILLYARITITFSNFICLCSRYFQHDIISCTFIAFLRGLKVGNGGLQVWNFQYVDDILIFCDPFSNQIHRLGWSEVSSIWL